MSFPTVQEAVSDHQRTKDAKTYLDAAWDSWHDHPNPGYTTTDGRLETLWGFPVTISVEIKPGTMIAVSGALKFDGRACKTEVDQEVVLRAIEHYQRVQHYSHDVSDALKGLPLERGE